MVHIMHKVSGRQNILLARLLGLDMGGGSRRYIEVRCFDINGKTYTDTFIAL